MNRAINQTVSAESIFGKILPKERPRVALKAPPTSIGSDDWTDTSNALHHQWMIIDSEDTLFRRKLEADQEAASGRYLAAAAHWDSFGASDEPAPAWDAEKTADFRTASQELRTTSEALYTASEALRRYITVEAKDTPPRG